MTSTVAINSTTDPYLNVHGKGFAPFVNDFNFSLASIKKEDQPKRTAAVAPDLAECLLDALN